MVDRKTYDLIIGKVEWADTETLVELAKNLGVAPPYEYEYWGISLRYPESDNPTLVWDRMHYVVIDPADIEDTYGHDSQQIDPGLFARMQVETADMEWSQEIIDYLAAHGVHPPDDEPGWSIRSESVDGRVGEQNVWYRMEYIPIVPDDSDTDDHG